MKNLGIEIKKLIINIVSCQLTKDDFPAKTFVIDKILKVLKENECLVI